MLPRLLTNAPVGPDRLAGDWAPGSRVRDRSRGDDTLAGATYPTLIPWHDAAADYGRADFSCLG